MAHIGGYMGIMEKKDGKYCSGLYGVYSLYIKPRRKLKMQMETWEYGGLRESL